MGPCLGLAAKLGYHFTLMTIDAFPYAVPRAAALLSLALALLIAQPARADGAAKAGVRATTRRILIIDDDVNVANVLARFLDGDEVTTVYSGQEGIAKLAQHEYDLVFCDLDVHPV